MLQRLHCQWKVGRLRQWSPDPDYHRKVRRIAACLREVAQAPSQIAALFMDQMGYTRWPTVAHRWQASAGETPALAHGRGNNQQWRVLGVVNAYSGRFGYLQNYIVGRQQLIAFYEALNWR